MQDTFEKLLTAQYRHLFATDPEYAYSAVHITPELLAQRMVEGLRTGRANKDGKGIKTVCKQLGIKYTYVAIRDYIGG